MSFPKVTFGTLTQLQFGNDDLVDFSYTHTFDNLVVGREYQVICQARGPSTEWPVFEDPEAPEYEEEPSPVLEFLQGTGSYFTELAQVSIYFGQTHTYTFVAKEPKLKVNYTTRCKGLGDGLQINMFQAILFED